MSLGSLREKAERHVVFPLNRDECIALVRIAEAADALVANEDGPTLDDMCELQAALRAAGGDRG